MRPMKRSASALRIRTTRTVSDVTAPVDSRISSGRSISPITSVAIPARSTRWITASRSTRSITASRSTLSRIRSMSRWSMAIWVRSSLSRMALVSSGRMRLANDEAASSLAGRSCVHRSLSASARASTSFAPRRTVALFVIHDRNGPVVSANEVAARTAASDTCIVSPTAAPVARPMGDGPVFGGTSSRPSSSAGSGGRATSRIAAVIAALVAEMNPPMIRAPSPSRDPIAGSTAVTAPVAVSGSSSSSSSSSSSGSCPPGRWTTLSSGSPSWIGICSITTS